MPQTHVRRALRPGAEDGGFTLIEVVVALTLMAVVATAALYFFVGGTRAVTHQQRSHGAVALANDAMERVFSYVAEISPEGTPGLVAGRSSAEVTSAWSAAAGISGISDTYPAWDRATPLSPLRLPILENETVSQVQFDVRTLIGYCYRVSSNPSGACTRVGGDSLGTPANGYVRMLRAIVVVDWQGTSNNCGADGCRYVITSLVDPNSDIKWNNTTRLQAMDDSVRVNAGEEIAVDVLANDAVMQLSSNPVSLVAGGGPFRAGTSTPMGSARVDTSSGKVVYTAPTDGYGEVTMVYRVDVGARNTQATVKAFIVPLPEPINATTSVGNTITIPVATRGGEASQGLEILTLPSAGQLTVVNNQTLRYVPAGAGTFRFTFSYRDPRNTPSLAGTGTIVVSAYAPATSGDVTFPTSGRWTAAPSPAQQTVDLRAATGNPAGYRVRVVSLPTGGTLRTGTNGSVAVNQVVDTLRWTPPANGANAYTFQYQVVDPTGGNPSPTATATLLVHPVANNVNATVRRNTNGSVQLTGLPTSGVMFTRTSTPSCFTANALNSSTGVQSIRGGSTANRSCSFTYTVSVSTPSGVLTSDPATATVQVTN